MIFKLSIELKKVNWILAINVGGASLGEGGGDLDGEGGQVSGELLVGR